MKIENILFSIILLLLICFSSCSNVKHKYGDRSMVQRQETIAVLRPNILVVDNGGKVKVDSLIEIEAFNLHVELYDWLERRKFENKLAVDIMDINESNEKLYSINELELAIMNKNEICNLLNVDAVLTSEFNMEKPILKELATITHTDGQSSKIKVILTLHDHKTSENIWTFKKDVENENGLTYKQLIDKVLSKAVKKMPYYSKRYKFFRDTKIDLSELDIN